MKTMYERLVRLISGYNSSQHTASKLYHLHLITNKILFWGRGEVVHAPNFNRMHCHREWVWVQSFKLVRCREVRFLALARFPFSNARSNFKIEVHIKNLKKETTQGKNLYARIFSSFSHRFFIFFLLFVVNENDFSFSCKISKKLLVFLSIFVNKQKSCFSSSFSHPKEQIFVAWFFLHIIKEIYNGLILLQFKKRNTTDFSVLLSVNVLDDYNQVTWTHFFVIIKSLLVQCFVLVPVQNKENEHFYSCSKETKRKSKTCHVQCIIPWLCLSSYMQCSLKRINNWVGYKWMKMRVRLKGISVCEKEMIV